MTKQQLDRLNLMLDELAKSDDGDDQEWIKLDIIIFLKSISLGISAY